MAIITPPAPFRLRGAKWRLPPSAQVNKSAWTGNSKAVGLPGSQSWTVSGTLVLKIGQANAKPWRAFFVQISQPFNWFPVIAVEARQTTAANPTVRAGAGNANTVPLAGLPGSATVLGAGDMMSVLLPSGRVRLVCLTTPLTTDASGNAVANFMPELGEIPNAGAAVEIQWPYTYARLTQNNPAGWDIDAGQKYTFQIDAEEAR